MSKSRYLTKDTHARSRTRVEGSTLTDPQYLDDCNIERTLQKYGAIQPPPVVPMVDVVGLQDFREGLERIEAAKRAFETQPATLRRRFGDDMRSFVDFVTNPANKAELIELGLIEAPVESKPVEVKVVNPSAPVSAAPADAQPAVSGHETT